MEDNATWSKDNITTDPNESNNTNDESNDVMKMNKKKKIEEPLRPDEHSLPKRQAVQDDKNTMEKIARLYTEISKRNVEITSLRKQFETYKSKTEDRQKEMDRLSSELQNKEKEIIQLKEEIQRLNTSIQDIQRKNTDLETQNKEKDKEINAIKDELEHIKIENFHSTRNLQPLPVPRPDGNVYSVPLNKHFGPGSKIVISGKAGHNFPRMNFNLQYGNTVALHVDNRWTSHSYNHLVLNTFTNAWGPEVTMSPQPIQKGADYVVSIECVEKDFKICIDSSIVVAYAHRVSPASINQLTIENTGEITSLYYRGS